MSVQKMMSFIDENKDKFIEKDYLEMCNILKHMYLKETDEDLDEDPDEDAEEDYTVMRIVYRKDLIKIIEDDNNTKPYFKDLLVKYKSDSEDLLDATQSMTECLIFHTLSLTSLQKIINVYGGKKKGFERMQIYMEDKYDEFMNKRYKNMSKRDQANVMAHHIIDHLIYEYNFEDDEDEDDAIDIKELFKICEHLHDL